MILIKGWLLAVSLLFVSIVTHAQPIRFSRFYDSDNGAGSVLNIVTSGSGFIGQGTNFKNGIRRSHTIKVDEEGVLLESHSVYGSNISYESFGMIRLSTGQLVSAGSRCDYNDPEVNPCDFYFARLDEMGDTLFTRIIERPDTSDLLLSMVETRPNKIMLIGWTYNDTTDTDADILLITVDTLGNELNRVVYGGGGTDFISDGVVVDTAGSTILVGYTKSFPSINNGRSWVVKTDAIGNVQWQRTYNGVGASTANGIRAVMLPDGHVIITGGKSGDGYLQKIDTAGNEVWIKLYDVLGGQGLWGVAGLDDGTIVSCGVTDDGMGGSQAGWLIKTDADGDTLWTRTYDVSDNIEYLRNMLLMPNGDIVMVGFGRGANSTTQDGWILRVDSMGCEMENCFITGVEETSFDSDQGMLQVYPNPNVGVFNIDLDGLNGVPAELLLYDLTGKQVAHRRLEHTHNTIQVEAADGLYLYTVR